ncbi:MAG: hypothetical protein SFX73_40150 [Kofleriaceae bacterium]|nr:hypothetical protein [Kofleriaceae bacterium]
MAKGKPAPEKSKLQRNRPLAYSRRSKPGGAGEGEGDNHEAEAKTADAASGAASDARDSPKPEVATPTEPAKPVEAAGNEEVAAIEPPPPKGEPWPDATPQGMRPVEPGRVTAEMVAVPPPELAPATPTEPPPPAPIVVGDTSVEDPTHMPPPKGIPGGNPSDPALPPGRVPPGDSRSLRRGGEFALVYRIQTCVISRVGAVGTRGVWRVVDYPTSAAASNAYAKECSRFVSDGFSDYRD